MSVQSASVPFRSRASSQLRRDPHPVDGLQGMIHRPFFTTAILTMLTVGASWGVIILWRIGFDENFTTVSPLEINAHGHAQVSGWVGLFMMGFAYRAFPRLWRTNLLAPRLAVAVFITMLIGVSTAVLGLGINGSDAGLPLAMVGGTLELAASLVFATQLLLTYRRSGSPLTPFVGFVTIALGWFIAQSTMGLWHTWTTMTATGDHLVWHIATYQAPLRDMQIHGLMMTMILGVSMVVLPGVFGLPRVPNRRAWRALVLITLAVLGESTLFILYRYMDNHWVAAFLLIPWIMLAVGATTIARPWQLWRPLPRDDGRSGKFIRVAYAWLALSLSMLILMPVYHAISGIGFSHAYYGAIRHAITVGFASMMIVGVSSRAVAAFHAAPLRTLPSLWGPFILINTGAFLRVTLQTLTDWYPAAYDLVGISSLFELTGFTWWGIGLIAVMRRGRGSSFVPPVREKLPA